MVTAILDAFFAPLGFRRTWALLFRVKSATAAPTAPPAVSGPAAALPTGGTVLFQRSQRSGTMDGSKSLLAYAEELGLKPTYGCRKGLCHSCTVPLVHGQARHLKTGILSPVQPGQNLQICIHVPAGDMVIDL